MVSHPRLLPVYPSLPLLVNILTPISGVLTDEHVSKDCVLSVVQSTKTALKSDDLPLIAPSPLEVWDASSGDDWISHDP